MRKLLTFATLFLAFSLFIPHVSYSQTINNDSAEAKYEWVDLGLSVKWASCNLGASHLSGYGDFYSWGNLSTSNSFTAGKCKTYNVAIDDIAGSLQYDVARVNMKGTWRLPTQAECEELIMNCDWTWCSMNGVYGFEVRSKVNGNSIFLPASGAYEDYADKNYDKGVLGCYWTSNPADKKFGESHMNEAYVLRFTSNGAYTLYYNKYYGYTIRPVCD